MRLIGTVLARWLLAGVALAGLLAAACGDSGPSSEGEGPLRVAVTLPLLADFVQQVGGDRVEVMAILPSGADPHTFELTPRVMQKLGQAEVVFVNGLGLEASFQRAIENNKRGDARLVALAEEVKEKDLATILEDDPGNPHLWLDISLAMRYVETIRDSLSAADPQGAGTYQARADTYLKQLDTLGNEIKGIVASVPPARRKLATSHDAFPYLARYLDFEVAGVIAPGPGQEPSPQDLAELLRKVEDLGIPAVFGEPQVEAEGRLLQQLAQDVDLQVCTLYSDALDARAPTYVEMMRFNGQELARCLGGEGG